MPDLQSELSKLANAWDTHEQTIRHDSHTTTHTKPQEKTMQTFIKTGNASRDLFDMIHAEPYKYTNAAAVSRCVTHGYKKSSVSALVTQMKRYGRIGVDSTGRLFTLVESYTPLPHNPKKPKAKPIKAKPASAGIAALPVAEEPVQRKQLVLKMTADDVLSKLDVREAFKLYQELAKMFGG